MYVPEPEISTYKKILPHADIRLGADGPGGQVQAMLRDAGERWIIVLDDNVKKFRCVFGGRVQNATRVDAQKLVSTFCVPSLWVWSINHCSNLWGSKPGDQPVRQLCLVYGACFGLRVPQADQERIRTKLGIICDDLERSLRMWRLRPGMVGRAQHWVCIKVKKPGHFVQGAGGISAHYTTAKDFIAARRQHTEKLAEEFPDLIQLCDVKGFYKFRRGAVLASRKLPEAGKSKFHENKSKTKTKIESDKEASYWNWQSRHKTKTGSRRGLTL